MPLTPYRIVLDTNVLLRGLINPGSYSGRVLAACDLRRVIPVLSKPVLREYRYILTDPNLVSRYPQLQSRKVEVALTRLTFVSDVIESTKVRFIYFRDPKDAKLIELAIAAEATHLLSYDADLLDLRGGHDEASKRFRQRLPNIEVFKPDGFLARFGAEVGFQ